MMTHKRRNQNDTFVIETIESKQRGKKINKRNEMIWNNWNGIYRERGASVCVRARANMVNIGIEHMATTMFA